jgi:hypothetical protein
MKRAVAALFLFASVTTPNEASPQTDEAYGKVQVIAIK